MASGRRSESPTVATQGVYRRLLTAGAQLQRARRNHGLSGVAALAELCHREVDGSYLRLSNHKHVSIIASALAEPSDSRVVRMLDAMSPEDAAFYGSEANVVLSSPSSVIMRELEERYAFVGGSHAEYAAYFNRRDIPDMWVFRPVAEVRAYSGFSAVRKKQPGAQRKLLMAVAANYGWVDPRRRQSLGLFGGGVFGSLWVPDGSIDPSIFDLDNAFTRVETPPWVWPWAATPPLLSGEVWNLLSSDDQARFGRGTPLAPMYKRLAMGMSHSVLILMSIVYHQIGRWLAASRELAETTCARHLFIDWCEAAAGMARWRRQLQVWRTGGVLGRGVVLIALDTVERADVERSWASPGGQDVRAAVLFWQPRGSGGITEFAGLLREAIADGASDAALCVGPRHGAEYGGPVEERRRVDRERHRGVGERAVHRSAYDVRGCVVERLPLRVYLAPPLYRDAAGYGCLRRLAASDRRCCVHMSGRIPGGPGASRRRVRGLRGP